MWDEYVWIVVVGSFLAFFTAYGIGANDVANAFASSVGSKALTITQAVIIAGIFEFAGSVLLGAQVTDTVRKKIADRDAFKDDPEVLMYGMLCVLAATGLWLLLATYLELPVSTTHSVIGAIIGMALTARGSDAVVWFKYDSSKEALKKFSGVVPVIISWVVSPVLSGLVAVFLFWFVRTFILRHTNSLNRALVFFPILVGITIAVNAYFIIFKGFKKKLGKNKEALSDILGVGWSSLIAWGLGAIIGAVLYCTFIPWLRQKALSIKAEHDAQQEIGARSGEKAVAALPAGEKNLSNFLDKDVHAVTESDSRVNELHESSEKFAIETEEAFKYLQVFTAICDSFAHGANDVANSIGPFAAIYGVYKNETIEKKSDVPIWILVLGGAGIVAGLATYGYNIIRAIGVKLVRITPSRGFAIELGSAVVIVTGSRYGIPLSTTHCQVGATVGVGLLEGGKGVNGMLFLKVITGWVITLIVAGFTSAAFFAQGAYAPSIGNLDSINRYQEGVAAVTDRMAGTFETNGDNATLVSSDKLAGDYTDVSEDQITLLNDTVTAIFETCKL